MLTHNPPAAFEVVRRFEKALCNYTGAPSAVAVNSCTMALRLCLDAHKKVWGDPLLLPKRTYVSVPMQARLAGYEVEFEDLEWRGSYQLKALPIWDCARMFTKGMFNFPQFGHRQRMLCLSFHFYHQ